MHRQRWGLAVAACESQTGTFEGNYLKFVAIPPGSMEDLRDVDLHDHDAVMQAIYDQY